MKAIFPSKVGGRDITFHGTRTKIPTSLASPANKNNSVWCLLDACTVSIVVYFRAIFDQRRSVAGVTEEAGVWQRHFESGSLFTCAAIAVRSSNGPSCCCCFVAAGEIFVGPSTDLVAQCHKGIT